MRYSAGLEMIKLNVVCVRVLCPLNVRIGLAGDKHPTA